MRSTTVILGLAALVAAVPSPASAQSRPTTSSTKSGEAGYRVGCSTAAAVGVRACDEVWSDKQKLEIERRKSESTKREAHEDSRDDKDQKDSRTRQESNDEDDGDDPSSD